MSRYNRVLAQRNSLLKALARHRVVPTSAAAGSQLAFWDTELVAFGSVVVSRRLAVVHRLSQLARQRFEWLTRGGSLSLSYQPSLILPALGEGAGGVDGDGLQAMVSREFEIRLEKPEPTRCGRA